MLSFLILFLHHIFSYPGLLQAFIQDLILGLPYPVFPLYSKFPYPVSPLLLAYNIIIVYCICSSKRKIYILKDINYMSMQFIKICPYETN